jgi:hypothetical protein
MSSTLVSFTSDACHHRRVFANQLGTSCYRPLKIPTAPAWFSISLFVRDPLITFRSTLLQPTKHITIQRDFWQGLIFARPPNRSNNTTHIFMWDLPTVSVHTYVRHEGDPRFRRVQVQSRTWQRVTYIRKISTSA